MAEGDAGASEMEFQRQEIERIMRRSMVEGEFWYLIDTKWFRNFKSYIGMEGSSSNAFDHPGPIDNSGLFKDNNCKGEIKEHLVDNLDYVLVPEDAWKLLTKWYGICTSQEPIMKRHNYPFATNSLARSVSNKRAGCSSTGRAVSSTSRHDNLISASERCIAQPGICGLCNLGNTCFMNSVIQCMSNCPPITLYFLNNEYWTELNEGNPLGMRGEIAKSFGELIKVLWSGKCNFTSPHNFKLQVARFAPQFSGYHQHDSQELLTFLLDGLHEDLNRIKKKPYIVLRDSDGRPDQEVAKEAWENYQKRNDSIIVDLFHGLLKSTVVCPDCSKISVTFDPFCYLSLPLPVRREKLYFLILVPYDTHLTPIQYRVSVPKNGIVRDLLLAVGRLSGMHDDYLVLTDVVNHYFRTVYAVNDPLDTIDEKDELYVYELSVPVYDPSYMILPVYLWEGEAEETYNVNNLFGTPFFIVLPLEVSYNQLYDSLLEKMKRFLRNQNGNANEIAGYFSNGEVTSTTDIGESGSDNETDDTDTSTQNHMETDFAPYPLFNIFIVDGSKSNISSKIHNGNGDLLMQVDSSSTSYFKSDLHYAGTQHLVLQWTPAAHLQWYCDQAASEIEHHESLHKRHVPKLLLEECLELYTTREKLGIDDAWYCPSCKKHQCATKKFDLWSLPNILIIHLKRFSCYKYRRDKIDVLVEFPLKGLDFSNYVIGNNSDIALYDLLGVCNHYGTMGGGHYTAYAQNRLDRKWYCFDDNNVNSLSPSSVVSSAAYVLFYIRRNNASQEMDVN